MFIHLIESNTLVNTDKIVKLSKNSVIFSNGLTQILSNADYLRLKEELEKGDPIRKALEENIILIVSNLIRS